MRKILLTFVAAMCCASIMATEGALPGIFTINADGDKVQFSRGNLQATYDGSNWTWGFAEKQWDYIGDAAANTAVNGNGTVSANGTVDLFCWSTTASYYGIHNNTGITFYAGDFIDWGDLIGDGWRTLTKDEWERVVVGHPHGQATVNGIHGLVVMPDGWTHSSTPGGLSFEQIPNNWTTNQYTAAEWEILEEYGALFLPAAGVRYGSSVGGIGFSGGYWSATSYRGPETNDYPGAYYAAFLQDGSAIEEDYLYYASSVRLVRDVKANEGIEEVSQELKVESQKVIRNGMLLIEKNGKTYNAQGAEVR